MTSGTFVRVRLFTDIEDVTLEKWLDADNAGQDELAKKILDAGLLVEHMIAEIPLEQNLADNSELRQLAENARKTFGLLVCFSCNRAFENKDEQVKDCPNCGAKLSKPELTSPESVKKKEPITKETTKETTKQTLPSPQKNGKGPSNKHPVKQKQPAPAPGKGKHTPPAAPASPSKPEDEKDEDWFGPSGQVGTGKRALKSR